MVAVVTGLVGHLAGQPGLVVIDLPTGAARQARCSSCATPSCCSSGSMSAASPMPPPSSTALVDRDDHPATPSRDPWAARTGGSRRSVEQTSGSPCWPTSPTTHASGGRASGASGRGAGSRPSARSRTPSSPRSRRTGSAGRRDGGRRWALGGGRPGGDPRGARADGCPGRRHDRRRAGPARCRRGGRRARSAGRGRTRLRAPRGPVSPTPASPTSSSTVTAPCGSTGVAVSSARPWPRRRRGRRPGHPPRRVGAASARRRPALGGRLASGGRAPACRPAAAGGRGCPHQPAYPPSAPPGGAGLGALAAVDPETAEVLRSLVAAHVSFVVSGGTGAGKTTVLGALLTECPPAERIVLVEDVPRAVPRHPHVVQLQGRAANVEGAGAVTMVDLVRQALRMRPDRLVVGEVRGAEVRELLAALNTGHDGGCGTLHANRAEEVPARFEALGALAGMPRMPSMPSSAPPCGSSSTSGAPAHAGGWSRSRSSGPVRARSRRSPWPCRLRRGTWRGPFGDPGGPSSQRSSAVRHDGDGGGPRRRGGGAVAGSSGPRWSATPTGHRPRRHGRPSPGPARPGLPSSRRRTEDAWVAEFAEADGRRPRGGTAAGVGGRTGAGGG